MRSELVSTKPKPAPICDAAAVSKSHQVEGFVELALSPFAVSGTFVGE
jgi:hypothetical protein